MSNHIIEVTSKNFVENVIKGSQNIPVIVDFWAPWCSPCKQLTPLIEKAVNAFSDKVILAKINIDEINRLLLSCKSNQFLWFMLFLTVK